MQCLIILYHPFYFIVFLFTIIFNRTAHNPLLVMSLNLGLSFIHTFTPSFCLGLNIFRTWNIFYQMTQVNQPCGIIHNTHVANNLIIVPMCTYITVIMLYAFSPHIWSIMFKWADQINWRCFASNKSCWDLFWSKMGITWQLQVESTCYKRDLRWTWIFYPVPTWTR